MRIRLLFDKFENRDFAESVEKQNGCCATLGRVYRLPIDPYSTYIILLDKPVRFLNRTYENIRLSGSKFTYSRKLAYFSNQGVKHDTINKI